MSELDGRRVAFVMTNGFEDSEFAEPWDAVTAAGAQATVVSTKAGTLEGKKGSRVHVDVESSAARADDYDALVLPGGVANGDKIRMDEAAVRFVRGFFEQDKPAGVICHGGWILTEADVLRGRTLTSYPSLKTDLRNAGATWVDEAVVVDRGLVSSRTPDDLPAFCRKLVEEIAEGKHPGLTP